MYRIAFCDDNKSVLNELTSFLEKYCHDTQTQIEYSVYNSSFDLTYDLDSQKNKPFDILFLDVLMPLQNGISVAKEIRSHNKDIKIIFLTTSSEFAVQSYTVDAFYYQLKPISERAFFTLMDLVLKECAKDKRASLLLNCKSGITRIKLSELEYCEVMGRTLNFHLCGGTVLQGNGRMDTLWQTLCEQERFIRPHRSFIVNMDLIQNISSSGILLASLVKIPIPRGKYTEVKNAYLNFAFKEFGGGETGGGYYNIMKFLPLVEYLFVSTFGVMLSAAYCNKLSSRKNRIIVAIALVVLLLENFLGYSLFGYDIWRKVYPFALHIPLVVLLSCMTQKISWSVISVATGYLCCQFRHWLGLFVSFFFHGSNFVFIWTKLIITFPLLIFLMVYVAPVVRSYQRKSIVLQWVYGGVPVFYYLFDYFFVVYTNLLYYGTPVVAEFMPFICCSLYLIFIFLISAEEKRTNQMKKNATILEMTVTQSLREIEVLRESQNLASQYRHDLRHHLQYITSCIENGKLEMVKNYIDTISSEIEAQKVLMFCENESLNLILSTFAAACEKNETQFNVSATLSSSLPISDSELCAILSNAIDNAINACNALPPYIEKIIDIHAFEKNGHLFFQISNTCKSDVVFKGGLPVTFKANHGFGTKSICSIVDRHGGIYNFSVKDNKFVLQISV